MTQPDVYNYSPPSSVRCAYTFPLGGRLFLNLVKPDARADLFEMFTYYSPKYPLKFTAPLSGSSGKRYLKASKK